MFCCRPGRLVVRGGGGRTYLTTTTGLGHGDRDDLRRTLIPRARFTATRNVPPTPVRQPPTFTQRPFRTRWIAYGLRPEPGRTWPQSTVRVPRRENCASGSAN